MIVINGLYDIRKLVAAAYDLSSPIGLGFLHYTPEPLSEEEITALINTGARCIVAMDYVKGRQCKFTVFQTGDGEMSIADAWFDHTKEDMRELLKRARID